MQIAPINIYIYEYHFFGLSALCSCYVATSLERLDILMVLFFFLESKSGLGIVIRDNAGLVIASCSQLLPQAYLTCEVEALAAVKALTFAQVVGISKAILEGDSKMLMKALVCDDVSMASHRSLIEDVKFNSRYFSQLHYCQVKKEGNKVTHYLTRYVIIVLDLAV